MRKSSTCQTPPVPPSTASRSPVSITTTRHRFPHPYREKKPQPRKFIIQCIFYTAARAASLLEKQIVTNPVTLLSTNDPKLKDHQKSCSHLIGFPNYRSTRHMTTGNSHGWELPNTLQKAQLLQKLIFSPAVESYSANLQFPVMSNPNMLQIIIF